MDMMEENDNDERLEADDPRSDPVYQENDEKPPSRLNAMHTHYRPPR